MRLLIFTVLFPFLAMIVLIAPAIASHGIPPLRGLLFFAYCFAIIPAWLLAAVDWTLSVTPRVLRLAGTTAAGGALVELAAWYVGYETSDLVHIGLMGTIPAAICSWLSGLSQKKEGGWTAER
jgi:hypothetical protein